MKTNLLKTAYCFCLLLLFGGGCQRYDDTAVWDELYNQSERLAILEAWQNTVNGNIDALRGLVAVLENNDYVTGVTAFSSPAPGGYTISFTKSAPVTITNGAKGDKGDTGEKGGKGDTGNTGGKGETGNTGNDGHTPLIGVKEDPAGSNIYYWTLDGDFLKDDSGNKIPVTGEKGDPGNDGGKGDPGDDGDNGQPGADGITPKLRINATTNYWEICTNGTCSDEGDWTNVLNSDGAPVKATGEDGDSGDSGLQGPQGDAIFATDGIDNNDPNYVVFTLADGHTTIKVPKYVPLGITFTNSYPDEFTLGQHADVTFTKEGNVQTIVAVDVPRGWTVTPKPDEGKITIAAPADDGKRYTAAGTATLLVSDGAERTITKPLALSCTPYQAPEQLGISFTQPETFLKGEEKKVPFTTQGGATIVKVLDVPIDWTVDIATSGAAGTFTITAPAKETGLLGALVLVSDAAGNTVMRTLELMVPTPADATVDFTDFYPAPGASTGTVWTLNDTREPSNNQTYKVRKMEDGRIWMVQDLKFGDKCGTDFSGSNGNDQKGKVTSLTDKDYFGDCTTRTYGSTPAERGYLYDWAAAIQKAGAYFGSSSNPGCSGTGASANACQGICPAGWHIPTGNTAGEFYALHNVSGRNCSTGNDDCWDKDSDWKGVLSGGSNNSGTLDGQGSYANYWSSTYSDSNFAYRLYFDSTHADPGTNRNRKWNGYSVRCVRNY